MAKHLKIYSEVKAAGNKPKIIKGFIGEVNSSESRLSIAKMTSPPCWVEPGQIPEFDEYTIVLKGISQRSMIK